MTESNVARIPLTNLRVPRSEFAALWITAEELSEARHGSGTDWYAAGAAATCEWLAAAVLRPEAGAHQPACSPVTGRMNRAYEELIDAELVAAERLAARDPRPARLVRRPGWIEGIVDTLRWAWLRAGPPPLRFDNVRDG